MFKKLLICLICLFFVNPVFAMKPYKSGDGMYLDMDSFYNTPDGKVYFDEYSDKDNYTTQFNFVIDCKTQNYTLIKAFSCDKDKNCMDVNFSRNGQINDLQTPMGVIFLKRCTDYKG